MSSIIYSDRPFEKPELLQMGNFRLIFYSRKSPLKTTPNEDSLGYYQLDDNNLVLMVADGAGGYPKEKKHPPSYCEQLVRKLKYLKHKMQRLILETVFLMALKMPTPLLGGW
ncbi:MAG: hypothetical protein R2827_05025 [Bdellovibrionales bacterium]